MGEERELTILRLQVSSQCVLQSLLHSSPGVMCNSIHEGRQRKKDSTGVHKERREEPRRSVNEEEKEEEREPIDYWKRGLIHEGRHIGSNGLIAHHRILALWRTGPKVEGAYYLSSTLLDLMASI